MKLKEIPIKDIRPNPLQPREHFDKEKIQELSDSIKEAGLIQPIVVKPKGKQFQVIAGERRWRALQLLKDKKVPSIIRDVDDLIAKELSLIENWHREDLTSVERENMVYDLWKTGKYKTRKELAKTLGTHEQTIFTILDAVKFRKKEDIAAIISSRVITDTEGLPDEERKEVIKRVERGDLAPKRVREEVKLRKLEKTLIPASESEADRLLRKKTPEDFVDELQTKLMETWVFIGVKFSDERRDEVLKWVSQHFTPEQKKELLQTMQITSLALERFMEHLK